MFGIPDLISLIISAFIILPVVVILRETGYVVAGFIFGAKNSCLTLGSGPRLFKIGYWMSASTTICTAGSPMMN